MSLKEVPNRVKYPEVPRFFLVKNHKYLLTCLYYVYAIMQYETWPPTIHCPWLVKNFKQSLFVSRTLIIFKPITFPFQGYSDRVTTPPCIYTTYIHLDNIININIISSQCHQHLKQSHSTLIHINSCLQSLWFQWSSISEILHDIIKHKLII